MQPPQKRVAAPPRKRPPLAAQKGPARNAITKPPKVPPGHPPLERRARMPPTPSSRYPQVQAQTWAENVSDASGGCLDLKEVHGVFWPRSSHSCCRVIELTGRHRARGSTMMVAAVARLITHVAPPELATAVAVSERVLMQAPFRGRIHTPAPPTPCSDSPNPNPNPLTLPSEGLLNPCCPLHQRANAPLHILSMMACAHRRLPGLT